MRDRNTRVEVSWATAPTTRRTAFRNHVRHTGSVLPISDTSGRDVTAHAPSIRPRACIHAIASAHTISRLGWVGGGVAGMLATYAREGIPCNQALQLSRFSADDAD